MKTQIALPAVLVLLFGLSGCATVNHRGKTIVMRAGATGHPNPSEVKSLERRSLRGDVKASIALAQYYDREKGDRLAAQPYYLALHNKVTPRVCTITPWESSGM